MPKTKVTPRAKHPNKTQQFLDATQIALETFEDKISLLAEEVCEKAYRNYVKVYKEALVPVWNLARFADIRTVLDTVTDKNMSEITTMAERLKPTSPCPKAISDKATILDLETVTMAMLQKFPGENWKCLLTTKHRSYSLLGSCTQIGRTRHPPHTSAVHSTPYGDCNSKYPVDRSGSIDIATVHTTSAQAGIKYDHGMCRDYELY